MGHVRHGACVLAALLVAPGISWAGGPDPGPVQAAAPLIGEVGLIAVGVGLLGIGGFVLLRQRR